MPPPALQAAVVLAASLVLILLPPQRLPPWVAAFGGGLLVVLLGLLSPTAALSTLAGSWDILLFFFGLGLTAATANQAGLIRAAALLAARFARGSQVRLLVVLYLAGVVLTAVLSNDATALLLTPVALAVTRQLKIDPRPYAFACLLVANAASFLLPEANPSNVLILTTTPLPIGSFLGLLLLPSLCALAATLAALLLLFRRRLREPFVRPLSTGAALDRRGWAAASGVVLLTGAYLVASARTWPLGPVAAGGALALLGLDVAFSQPLPGERLRSVPWSLFPLLAGLLLLVQAANQTGLFAPLPHLIDALTALGAQGAVVVVFGLALLANVINNLPAALIAAAALQGLPVGNTRAHLAAVVLVGVNLGPNLTPVGALANLLWLALLRRDHLHVSTGSYLRVGLLTTIPALAAAAVGLWLALLLPGA